jgi:hypothetical protein
VLILRRTIVLIQLLVSEWSKITRIHRVCIVHETLTINEKIIMMMMMMMTMMIIIIIINIQL